MAGSATDKARKSYSYLQKTLNGAISDVALALTPNNVTSIPTDTGVSFAIDRVDSNGTKTPTLRELMTGVVSGSTIASLIRGEQGTTAQPHANNAVIEFVNSGEMWNDLIDFLLQDHSNPDGHHKTLTDDNGNEWLERGSVASAVNQIKLTNSATLNPVKIDASGDDSNIGITMTSKGSGDIKHVPGSTGKVYTDGAVPRSYFALYDFVESGILITGDSLGTNKNYSISSGVVWIGGKRLTVAAVSAQVVTASKDRYIDLRDNSDGTAVYVTNEVTNNAASQALTAGDMRVGIVVAGATTIADAGSINQGEETKVLPIASSIPYAVTDSLGNLICPRDPARKLLGYRQTVADQGSISNTDVTGLSVPYLALGSRKVKVTGSFEILNGTGNGVGQLVLKESATQLKAVDTAVQNTAQNYGLFTDVITTPSAGLHTYKVTAVVSTGTGTVKAATTNPAFIRVENE